LRPAVRATTSPPKLRRSVKHVEPGERSVKHMANRKRPNFLGVWLSDAARAAVEEHREHAQVSRSEVVRRMLAYAVWKMPKGWKP
jgi:hypothetical protein